MVRSLLLAVGLLEFMPGLSSAKHFPPDGVLLSLIRTCVEDVGTAGIVMGVLEGLELELVLHRNLGRVDSLSAVLLEALAANKQVAVGPPSVADRHSLPEGVNVEAVAPGHDPSQSRARAFRPSSKEFLS